MGLTIKYVEIKTVLILDLQGRIDINGGTNVLRDRLRELVSEGKRKILLNLDQVEYVDADGVGELVSGLVNSRNHGGELKLCNMSQQLRNRLTLSGLYSLFNVYEDENTAVKSFQG